MDQMTSEDIISREAACKTLFNDCHIKIMSGNNWIRLEEAVSKLSALPSTQPEIIRCKDCKHWLPHKQFGYDEDNEEYHDYCAKLIPEDKYYAFRRHADEWCNRAERREI